MIELKNVHKSFGRKKVLKGIDFTIPKGEITALIGVNGVGKTTILQHIMRLTPMDKGEILVNGKNLGSELYETVSFIPDAAIMLPKMTIREAMDFMATFYDCWNEDRAQEILKFFRLKESDRISDLSKGNVAKANMLFSLALDTEYILLDEPFSGIDIFTREEIIDIFSSYLVKDRGVLITTHEIDEIEQIVDRVVVIEDGVIVTEFNVEEMREVQGKSIVDVLREIHNRGDLLGDFDQKLMDPDEEVPFSNFFSSDIDKEEEEAKGEEEE